MADDYIQLNPDVKEWSRRTAADGMWLNDNTIKPIKQHISAFSGFSAYIDDKVDGEIDARIDGDEALASALNSKIDSSEKGANGGVATLGNDGKVPASQLPDIPVAQVQADWEQTVTTAVDYIKNKPTIPAAQVNADWNAVSGIAEILNKPEIPAAQVNADWDAVSGVEQILNKPTIPDAQVNADWEATSGIAEILNKPTIPLPANNATITIQGNSTDIDSFTLNQSANKNINITPSNIGAVSTSNFVQGAFGEITAAQALKFTFDSNKIQNFCSIIIQASVGQRALLYLIGVQHSTTADPSVPPYTIKLAGITMIGGGGSLSIGTNYYPKVMYDDNDLYVYWGDDGNVKRCQWTFVGQNRTDISCTRVTKPDSTAEASLTAAANFLIPTGDFSSIGASTKPVYIDNYGRVTVCNDAKFYICNASTHPTIDPAYKSHVVLGGSATTYTPTLSIDAADLVEGVSYEFGSTYQSDVGGTDIILVFNQTSSNYYLYGNKKNNVNLKTSAVSATVKSSFIRVVRIGTTVYLIGYAP